MTVMGPVQRRLPLPVDPTAVPPLAGLSSETLAAWLAADPDFKGIGPARARRLAEVLGEDLERGLAEGDPRIVALLGDAAAERALEVYAWKAPEARLIAHFEAAGLVDAIGTSALVRVARAWGPAGVESCIENPYLLVAVLLWAAVDRIGRTLGIAPADPRRLAAAAEAALYARLDRCHTWTPRDEAVAGVARLLGLDPEKDAITAQSALDAACAAGGAVLFEGGYQSPGAAAMEAEVAARIRRLVMEGPRETLFDLAEGKWRVSAALAAYEARQSWPLTEAQRAAIELAARSRVMVLGGYAGSGKTTVLAGVCDVLEAKGITVRLMALSGRAAQRVAASTGRKATTIAAFLLALKAMPPLGPYDAVIIDEASMIDLPTIWRILRRLGDARLILAGDPGQLPPIGMGLVLHALIEAPEVPKVVLDRVMRQSEASGIPAVADAIRNGRMPQLPRFEGRKDGVSFEPCRPDQAIEWILEIGRRLRAEGVQRGEMQIIAPVRRGPAGINAINAWMHARHMERGAVPPTTFLGRPDIAVGEPIIWTKNDWDRGLMNGSMGRLLSAFPGGGVADLDGQEVVLSSSDADRIELAYAISVHRAQGSQWPVVIYAGFQTCKDRRLTYTAVTRAATQVVMVSADLKFPTDDIRREALGWRLGAVGLLDGRHR